jgi:hypothetical protein
LARNPTPQAKADAALLEMLADRPGRAEGFLSSVAAAEPAQTSDLAAFLLARASRPAGGQPDDLVRSLAVTETALAAAPQLPEARFNRAAVLEKLGLLHCAAEAWRAYLHDDASSGWADLARQHLHALSWRLRNESGAATDDYQRRMLASALEGNHAETRRLVLSRPDIARAYGLESLLGKWASASGSIAAAILGVAQTLGEAVASANGDCLLRDEVAAIEQGFIEGTHAATQLRRAHHTLQQGIEMERREDYTAAASRFAAAEAALAQMHSPGALLAALHVGVCQYYAANYPAALSTFARVRSETGTRPYPAVIAYSLWMSGVAHFASADLQRALADHLAALRIYIAQHEPSHAAFTSLLIAVDLFSVGERERSWLYRIRALQDLSLIQDPRRVYSALWSTAEAEMDEHRPAVAQAFLSELLARLGRGASAGILAETLARRGLLAGELGDRNGALADLAAARRQVGRVADPSLRERVNADLCLTEARVLFRESPRRALDLIATAANFYARAGYRADFTVALRTRAAAFRSNALPAPAMRALEEALADYERGRLELLDESSRIRYFEQAREVVEDLLAIELEDLGSAELSFLTADRARSRGLLDHLHQLEGGAEPIARPAALTRCLSGDSRLVEFATFGDRTAAWVANGNGTDATILPLGGPRLEALVRHFRDEIAGGLLQPPSGRELYRALISPLRAHLAGASTIVFVPDEALVQLPFAALQDPATDRFLIEDFAVQAASSAAVFLRAVARSVPGPPRSLLLVEGDGFDRRTHPGLEPLPSSRLEPAALSRLYPQVQVLQGEHATKAALLAALPKSEVIHLTAHYIRDPEAPTSPALLLAAGGRSTTASDLLRTSDILGRRLAQLRVVVLAGCDTAAAPQAFEEGSLSLARAFLAGGARSVLETLWSIDDAAAERLTTSFHQQLAGGASPSAALRASQLAMLRSDRTQAPVYWAGFQLLGGSIASKEELRRTPYLTQTNTRR